MKGVGGSGGLGGLGKKIGNTWGFLASHRSTNHISFFVEMMVLGNELLIPKESQGSVVHIREPHVILWLEGIARQMFPQVTLNKSSKESF